jgi:hypothetical protein
MPSLSYLTYYPPDELESRFKLLNLIIENLMDMPELRQNEEVTDLLSEIKSTYPSNLLHRKDVLFSEVYHDEGMEIFRQS